jgi:hypothetical protein
LIHQYLDSLFAQIRAQPTTAIQGRQSVHCTPRNLGSGL